MTVDTEARLDFVCALDALKGVERRTRILDGSRYENTAEHSWHLAMMALTLAPEADEQVDVARVVELLLVHDIVEIDADDTFVYDLAGRESKAAREEQAADRLFAMTGDEGARLRTAWEEYESGDTPEGRFARAVDRFQPMLLNMGTGGGSWTEHGIRADQVLAVNRGIAAGSIQLWERARDMVDEAVARGWLLPAAGEPRADAPGLPVELHTDRLRLRWARLGDAQALLDAYAGDPEVARFLVFEAHESADTVERDFLRNVIPALGRGDEFTWVIEEDGVARGAIAARVHDANWVSLGYALGREHWGRGLMTEATRAVTEAVFAQTSAQRVSAHCDVDNPGSARVLEKAGFTEEGTLRAYESLPAFDEPRDCRLFARLRTD